MTRKLTTGDTFRIHGLRPVAEVVHAKDNQPPTVNAKRLCVDRFALVARTVVPWTETQPGGWERRRETQIDRSVGDMSDVVWRVVGARLGGGGTAMATMIASGTNGKCSPNEQTGQASRCTSRRTATGTAACRRAT